MDYGIWDMDHSPGISFSLAMVLYLSMFSSHFGWISFGEIGIADDGVDILSTAHVTSDMNASHEAISASPPSYLLLVFDAVGPLPRISHTQVHKYYQPKHEALYRCSYLYPECLNLVYQFDALPDHSLPCFLSEQGRCPVFMPLFNSLSDGVLLTFGRPCPCPCHNHQTVPP